jgi:hypothetical protein
MLVLWRASLLCAKIPSEITQPKVRAHIHGEVELRQILDVAPQQVSVLGAIPIALVFIPIRPLSTISI